MGNLENSLKMYFMLSPDTLIKCKDIATKLEVNERQVRRYKDILSNFIEIESLPGKDGGYRLKEESLIKPKSLLSNKDIVILSDFVNNIDKSDINNNQEIINAIEKINYSIENNEKQESVIIPYSRVKPLDKKTEEFIKVINYSIIDSKEIIIEYKGNNGEVSNRRVQPYKIASYKGEKYLYCYCLLKGEIRNFKIRRIISCTKTEDTFEKTIDMNKHIEEERENNLGIFGGKEFKIKLYIKNPMANTIKERIWVDNQVIDEDKYSDGILFKAKMKGGPELISWLLSMGDTVNILEPIELKEKYRDTILNMMKNLE